MHIDKSNSGLVIPSIVVSVRVDETKVDSKFLTYYLNSKKVKKELQGSVTGTAINMIKTKALENLKISLPPLQEQKKIVEFLDLAKKEIKLLQDLQNKKERYYKEIFEKILEKGVI